MPVWQVSEPYINLWLQDEPLGYQPVLGPRVSFHLSYKQREVVSGFNTNIFSVGKKWNFSWFSYVTQDTNGSNVVHFDGGRQVTFYGTNDYLTYAQLSGNTNSGFTLSYPDGSQNVYGFMVTNSSGAFQDAFLSQRKNAQAQATLFNYSGYASSAPVIRLQSVVDGDGRTNLLYYVSTNAFSTNLISQVVDAFGRTNSLAYDSTGHLTNIIDVAGLSASYTYDGNDYITNLTTPYGATTFQITDTVAGNFPPNGRSILVTTPDTGHQLFLYSNSAPGIAVSYSSGQIPGTTPFSNTLDTTNLDVHDTFYWGPAQYLDLLSDTNISSLTTNDFRKARMRHWLQCTNPVPQTLIGQTVSMERIPSPDTGGTIEGQKTWYDYAGKATNGFQGTQSSPLLTARVLPDGTTSFNRSDRNSIGNVLTNVSTYSIASTVLLRTNIFAYDSTLGIDLIVATNALGVQVSSNAYNAYHQVLTNYDALNEMTVDVYNGTHQVIGVTSPSGLITTNIYESDGWLATNYAYAIVGGTPVYFGTNIYTYTNDLVFSHKDERGLTTTNTWDNLQRLVKMTYPDGTFVSNTFAKLDLVLATDRMGFTNAFGYDALRRKIAETNALGNYTLYNYCVCGALESIRDALGNYTYFYYDNLNRLTNAVYADGYSLTNQYNLLDQVTNAIDGGGVSVTNWFNNQRSKYAASNYFGRVFQYSFDPQDRITNSVDANSVTITNTYDNLNRILTSTYPDGGVEKYVYTTNGLVARINQLNQTNLFAYDALGRKITETNANLEITQFSYNGASDLLTLTDGKSQVTTWNYTIYGFVSNKVDAASNVILVYHYDADNRLTNRWSAAKSNTYYYYDHTGNLTNVVYPVSPALAFSYDALNRLTNLVDAAGATGYGYDAAGQLLSEDGPWANDTVSYTYNNRLRTSLGLLQPNAGPWNQTYAYDGAKRLNGTISPAGAFGYTYDATRQSQLSKLALPNTAYITNTFDSVARLLSTSLENSGNTVLNSHSYSYNTANQRTQQTRTKGDYVNYTYDTIGQLTNATGLESGGVTNRWQEQLSYVYDKAHNLNYRTNNALVQTFGVNSDNELSTVTRNSTGALTVTGTSSSQATNVTVNTTNAILYADYTFAATNFTPVNGANTYTAIAKDSLGRLSTNAVTVNLPSSATYSYDLNGNLLSDGTRAFAYDDENELIQVTLTNACQSQFLYDGKLRRRVMKEFTWRGSAWVETNEIHYVYDGNLTIQERDTNNLPQVGYTRGNDLSGTLQGAGGIGGLLAFSQISALNPQHFYYHADGNGNITALINAQQVIAGRYLYDPFGHTLSLSGTLANANPYRFSSKEYHQNSGLVYYLYRFYDANLQRWQNRDPNSENGGINLYDYVLNDSLANLDYFGLACCGQNNQNYNPTTECCEDGKVVEKVSMWICTRPVNSWYGPIAPGHQDVCCDGPYLNCFGHTDNNLKKGRPIPPHFPTPIGSRGCEEKKVCPKTKKAHCDNPTSPCAANSITWNCRCWANWDGISTPFPIIPNACNNTFGGY